MLKLSEPTPWVEDGDEEPIFAVRHVSDRLSLSAVVSEAGYLIRSVARKAAEAGTQLDWQTARIEARYNPTTITDELLVRVWPKPTTPPPPPTAANITADRIDSGVVELRALDGTLLRRKAV